MNIFDMPGVTGVSDRLWRSSWGKGCHRTSDEQGVEAECERDWKRGILGEWLITLMVEGEEEGRWRYLTLAMINVSNPMQRHGRTLR